MTSAFDLSPFRTPSAAEERAERQDDHAGARREAALERVRVAVAAAQRVADEVHRTNGINIIDVADYLAAAMGAVESEMED